MNSPLLGRRGKNKKSDDKESAANQTMARNDGAKTKPKSEKKLGGATTTATRNVPNSLISDDSDEESDHEQAKKQGNQYHNLETFQKKQLKQKARSFI